MAQTISVPGQPDYEFPDGMSDEQMQSAIEADLRQRGVAPKPKDPVAETGSAWASTKRFLLGSDEPGHRSPGVLPSIKDTFLPPEGEEASWGDALSSAGQQAWQSSKKIVAGAKEFGAAGDRSEADQELERLQVLPAAVARAKANGTKLEDDPGVIATAVRLGIPPHVFLGGGANGGADNYASMSPKQIAERKAIFAKQLDEASGSEADAANDVSLANVRTRRLQQENPTSDGSLKSLTTGLVSSAPAMAASIGAGAVAGPEAGMAVFALATAPEAYADAKDQGYNESTAQQYALFNGLASLAPAIPLTRVLARTPEGQEALHTLLTKLQGTRGGRAMLGGASGATGGMVMESLNELNDTYTLNEDITLDEAFKRLASSALVTGVMGAGHGAVSRGPARAGAEPGAEAAPSAEDMMRNWQEGGYGAAPLDAGGLPGPGGPGGGGSAAPGFDDATRAARAAGVPDDAVDMVIDLVKRGTVPLDQAITGLKEMTARAARAGKKPAGNASDTASAPSGDDSSARATAGDAAPENARAAAQPEQPGPEEQAEPATSPAESASPAPARALAYDPQQAIEKAKQEGARAANRSDVTLDGLTLQVNGRPVQSFHDEPTARLALAQARKQVGTAADPEAIDDAAHTAAASPLNDRPEPTPAQREAGNYQKGHLQLHGLNITIENPIGSVRQFKGPNPGSRTMADHYGYIRGTLGRDGDHVDTFVGPNPESTQAFVIDQPNAKGGFDEHKVMLGYKTKAQAVAAYKRNYQAGWKVGPVKQMGVDELKQWVDSGDHTQPFHPDKFPKATVDERVQRLAKQLAHYGDRGGWAEKGGSIIRKNQDPNHPDYSTVTGRTKWLPNEPWFPELQRAAALPKNELGAATKEAVRKALAGEKLSMPERRHVNTLMDIIEDDLKEHSAKKAALANLVPDFAEASPNEQDLAVLADQAREYDEDATDAALESQSSDAEVAARLNAIIAAGKDAESGSTDQIAADKNRRGQGEEAVLTTHTEADVRAREQAAKDRADAEAAAERKAAADKDAKQFALTGSARPSDANAKQSDIFGLTQSPSETKLRADIKAKLFRFASGMSRPGDIVSGAHGTAGTGKLGIGVDAGELTKNAIATLAERVVNIGADVFVDSGAFGLFKRGLKGEDGVRPMNWPGVLNRYSELEHQIATLDEAEENKGSVTFVMPDVIGDQAASIELLNEHHGYVGLLVNDTNRKIDDPAHDTRKRAAIIPIQKGEKSLSEVYATIKRMFGNQDFLVGIPSQEAAVSNEELRAFLKETKPPMIHFLGAISDAKLAPKLEAIAQAGYLPKHISADGNLLRSTLYGKQEPGSDRREQVSKTLNGKADEYGSDHTVAGEVRKTRQEHDDIVRELQGEADSLNDRHHIRQAMEHGATEAEVRAALADRSPTALKELHTKAVERSGGKRVEFDDDEPPHKSSQNDLSRDQLISHFATDKGLAELSGEVHKKLAAAAGVKGIAAFKNLSPEQRRAAVEKVVPPDDGNIWTGSDVTGDWTFSKHSGISVGDKVKARGKDVGTVRAIFQLEGYGDKKTAHKVRARVFWPPSEKKNEDGIHYPNGSEQHVDLDKLKLVSSSEPQAPAAQDKAALIKKLQGEAYNDRDRRDIKKAIDNGATEDEVRAAIRNGADTAVQELLHDVLTRKRVSTAPEHTHNVGKPLDESVTYEPVAKGNPAERERNEGDTPEGVEPLEMAEGDFAQMTDEFAALFDAPKERVRAKEKAKAVPKMTVEQAHAKVQEWKDRAKAQFDDERIRSENSRRTILSLFDYTGEWSKPWEEAGYNVIRFDIQNGQDIHDFSVDYFANDPDMSDISEVYGILAATPCTDFASSGARHFEQKDKDGRTEASKELVFQTLRTIEYFRPKVWTLENPVGRIERLTGLPPWRMSFDPSDFGSPYTKKTLLWGKFNADLPVAPVEPTEGSKMWSMFGGKSLATKNARSETPEGFAYAYFMANNFEDRDPVERTADDYPEVSGAVRAAFKAGITEEQIRAAMHDTYENYEHDAAALALQRMVELKNEAEKDPIKTAVNAALEDAGVKIGGARKDMWASRGLNLDDLDSMSEAEGAELVNKAAVYKPDYADMVSNGTEPVAAALLKIMYDKMAAKPNKNTPDGRRQYVTMMQAVRKVASEIKTLQDAEDLDSRVRQEIGWGINANQYDYSDPLRHTFFSIYKGRKSPFESYTTEKRKAKLMVEQGFPNIEAWNSRFKIKNGGGQGITEDGVKYYMSVSAKVGTPLTEEQIRAPHFVLTDKENHVVGFAPTREAAVELAKSKYGEVKTKAKKAEPKRPHLDIVKRDGLPERRTGDVASQDFVDDFKFRGIEFGNWAASDERQRLMNLAYDGLHDLADVLNVPPEALSLNGTMGLALGARGNGRGAAHYEPGKLVINMTKINGAGSLAHEWGHAMDHYFGELGREDAYKTEARGISGWRKPAKSSQLNHLRPEMQAAFKGVLRAIFRRDLTKAEKVRDAELALEKDEATEKSERQKLEAWEANPNKLDPTYGPRLKIWLNKWKSDVERSKKLLAELRALPDDKTDLGSVESSFVRNAKELGDYWQRPTELLARSFESYVQDMIKARGGVSQYLVHGTESGPLNTAATTDNPYPAGRERTAINAAYKNLFEVMSQRPGDDGNVILFHKAEPEAPSTTLHEDAATYSETLPVAGGEHSIADRKPKGTKAEKSRQIDIFAPQAAQMPARRAAQFMVKTHHAQIGSYRSGIDKVTTWQDAAHIIAPLRKSAQEQMLAVVLDKDDKPLAIIRHTVGTKDSATVDAATVAAAVTRVDGAKSVYFAHNHPSGTMESSGPDQMITARLHIAMDGTGIEPRGMLIVGFGSNVAVHYTPESRGWDSKGKITPGNRMKGSVPLTERRLLTKVKGLKPLESPRAAQDFISNLGEKSGLMLMDNRHNPAAFVPLTNDEMRALRDGSPSGALHIMQAIDTSNAAAAIVFGEGDAVRNVGSFMSTNAPDVRVLDGLIVDPDGSIESLAEKGMSVSSGQVFTAKSAYPATPKQDGVDLHELVAAVRKLASGNAVNPDQIHIVNQVDALPAAALKAVVNSGGYDLATAFYWRNPDTGQRAVYLISNRIRSMDAVPGIMAHELVTHFGLKAMLSRGDYAEIMDGVWRDMRMEVRRRGIKEFGGLASPDNPGGFDENKRSHRWKAAEELIAYHSMDWVHDPKAVPESLRPWYERLKDMLIKLWRSVTGQKHFDGSFINDLLKDLQEFIKTGEKDDAYEDGEPMHAKSPSFAKDPDIIVGDAREPPPRENPQPPAPDYEQAKEIMFNREEKPVPQDLAEAFREYDEGDGTSQDVLRAVEDLDPEDLPPHIVQLADAYRKAIQENIAEWGGRLNEDDEADPFMDAVEQYVGGGPMMHKAEPKPIFYSALAKAVETAKREKGTAAEWMGTLRNMAGVKQEELEWVGLEDWMKDRGRIDRAQVLDYVQKNQIQVEERQLASRDKEQHVLLETLNRNGFSFDTDMDGSGYLVRISDGASFEWNADHDTFEPQDADEAGTEPVPLVVRNAALELGQFHSDMGDEKVYGAPKHAQYKSPGGKNYRELLLKLPRVPKLISEEGLAKRKAIFDAHQPTIDQIRKEFDDAVEGRTEYSEPDGLVNIDRRLLAAERQRDFDADQAYTVPAEYPGYQSTHWDDKNVLAHVRFDTRHENGVKILHIAEIQSDWHQKGRKVGYKPVPDVVSEEAKKRLEEIDNKIEAIKQAGISDEERQAYFEPGAVVRGYGGLDKVIAYHTEHTDENGRYVHWSVDVIGVDQHGNPKPGERKRNHSTSPDDQVRAALMSERNDIEASIRRSEVPDAPFKTTWPELAIKRMIRYAADNGHDRITWDPGDVQAARYSLAAHIDTMNWSRRRTKPGEPGKMAPVYYKIAGFDPNHEAVIDKYIDEADLADNIGQELAAKIIADTIKDEGSLTNLDLKVGGNGMRGFYDKQLPATINKYVKKWGAKVITQVTAIPTGEPRKQYFIVGSDGNRINFQTLREAIEFATPIGIPIDVIKLSEGSGTVERLSHSLDITDDMKDAALEGQPMFVRQPGQGPQHPLNLETLSKERKGAYEKARGVVIDAWNSELSRSLRKLIDPVNLSSESKETARIARGELGKLAHETHRTIQELERFAAQMDKLSPDDQLTIIHDIETGSPATISGTQPIINTLRKMLDAQREKVQALGVGALDNFIENYFPHYWQDPSKAEKLVGMIMGRRPMKGPATFLKKRTIPTIRDGIAYGLKPLTTNPLTLTVLKMREMQRFVAGVRLMQFYKAHGLAQFFASGMPLPDRWVEIKDAVGRVRQWSDIEGGFIERGRYAMPEDAARVINNHLSGSVLQGFAPAQVFRVGSNMLNALQLGFSGFHLGFTTMDAIISKGAVGVERLAHGEPLKALQAFAAMATGPGEAAMNIARGAKLLKAYSNMSGATPEMAALVRALEAGGGRVRMDRYFMAAQGVSPFHGVGVYNLGVDLKNALTQPVGKLTEATRVLQSFPLAYATKLVRDLQAMGVMFPKWQIPFEVAGRVTRASTAIIMEHIVPLQKLGVFSDLASDWLRRNPSADPIALEKAMQEIWKTVDNRLGEMVYDNVFWDRTFKDVLHFGVRAVGWNYGTARLAIGAPSDVVRALDKLATGDKLKGDDIGHNIPYWMSAVALTMLAASIYQYLHTGKGPQEPKDYFFPQSGGKTKYGTPNRVSMPSYIKDMYEYYQQPGHTAINKLNPIFNVVASVMENEDFYGNAIENPDDPFWTRRLQDAQYVLREGTPFSLQGRQHLGDAPPESMVPNAVRAVEPFIGITPAPGRVTSPDQLERAQHLREENAYLKGVKQRQKEATSKGDSKSAADLREEARDVKRRMHENEQAVKRDRLERKRSEHQAPPTSSILQHVAGRAKPEQVAALHNAGMPALAALWGAMPDKPRPVVAQAMADALNQSS